MVWIYSSFIQLSKIKIGRHFLKGSYSSSGSNNKNNNETKPVSFACIEQKRTAAVTAVKNNLYIVYCVISLSGVISVDKLTSGQRYIGLSSFYFLLLALPQSATEID